MSSNGFVGSCVVHLLFIFLFFVLKGLGMLDVTSFLGGNFLTQLDLPPEPATWRIASVQKQQVGSETKVCITFCDHHKPLAMNKTNLRVVAESYGNDGNSWIGKPVELFRDRTQYQGNTVSCIRVRIPARQSQQPQQLPVAFTTPTSAAQPQVASDLAPWEIDHQQQNNPPST